MSSSSAALNDDQATGLVGTRMGPYRIIKEVGRGAIGVIYRADPLEGSGASVAVKVLAPSTAGDVDERARLLREWKALGRVQHAGVVKALDHGEDAVGRLWFAMELADGPSLDQVVKRVRALDGPEVLYLARALAASLAAVHSRDVAHRDVKPANVVLDLPAEAPSGADARVLLVDFGLARRKHESMIVTSVGKVVGTPLYLAPERLKGDPGDPRSDLYSLGATLFFAATSSPPFLANDSASIMKAHLEAKPPNAAEAAPSLHPILADVIDALLAKNPAQRPSAAEMLAKLDAIPGSRAMPPTLAAAIAASRSDVERTHAQPQQTVAEPPPLGRFGRYLLESELARGGMGVVYRAKLPELNRLFALKVMLSGEHAGEAQRKRFLREAEAAAALDHPGIVRVHDYGEHEGRAYFVMDLVQGCALNTHYRREGMTLDRHLLPLFAKVCEAVHYAHSRGIVHRDLKPANVLVDDQTHPRILDFGLAKRIGGGEGDSAALTTEGELLGTAAYMSPEQAEGRVRDVDTRSDVYALGVILYELATKGRLPFEGSSVREVLNGIYFNDPTPPSQVAKHPVPWEVDAIVLKAIDKVPARRYQSAAALAEDVGRFVDGLPISARRAGPLYRFVKLVKRKSKTFAVLASLFGAALLWAGFELHQRELRRDEIGRSVREYVANGETWLERNDPHKAKNSFLVALQLDPKAPGADIGLVRAEHAIEARDQERRAIERKNDARKLVEEGRARLAARDADEARRAFFQAIAFDGESKDAREGLEAAARLAVELDVQRQRERGEAAAKKLADVGTKLLESGDAAGARRAFDQALAFDGKNAIALDGLGRVARRLEEERARNRREEAVRHLKTGQQALDRARTQVKGHDPDGARRTYYDAIESFERAMLVDPDLEDARKARSEAARELARILREANKFDLAEFVLRLSGADVGATPDEVRPEFGDEALLVREMDSVIVQRAYREPIEFSRGDAFLASLREEAERYDKRYQVIVDIRSRVVSTTPPKVFVTGIVVRVTDRRENVTSTPESIMLEGEGCERVVIAGAGGRTISSWERSVGIDASDMRAKLLEKVKERLESFESRHPSPPKSGRLR